MAPHPVLPSLRSAFEIRLLRSKSGSYKSGKTSHPRFLLSDGSRKILPSGEPKAALVAKTIANRSY